MWGESGRPISLPSVFRATISASRTSLNGWLHPVRRPTGPRPLHLLTLLPRTGQRGVARDFGHSRKHSTRRRPRTAGNHGDEILTVRAWHVHLNSRGTPWSSAF